MKLQNISKNRTSFKIGSYLVLIGVVLALAQKGITAIKKVEPSPTPTVAASYTSIVSKVIDGDTIVLSTGEEVRYIGINTPEIELNECFATESAKANSDLVLGKVVKLVKDTSETDKYGRLLRYVYVVNPEQQDGVEGSQDIFVNDYLVNNGYAKVMTVKPDVEFESTFVTSEKFAKVNNLGLWGKCGK